MRHTVAVQSPEPRSGTCQRGACRIRHLLQVNETVYETRLGDELLQIGRHCGTRGQYHGLRHRRRSQAKPRERPVDDGEADTLPMESVYLLAQHLGGRGTREDDLAPTEHFGGDQLSQRRATGVHIDNLRHQPPLQVVPLGGDEAHALIESNLGFRCGIDRVRLLAVDTYGGDSRADAEVVEPSQDVVQADRLAGILLQSHDGDAVMVQYVVDKRHGDGVQTEKQRQANNLPSYSLTLQKYEEFCYLKKVL